MVKDKVWDYEKEWRVIDPQNIPDNPSLISLPFIKSITMGTKIKPLIKNWIVNICNDKNIDCYELKLSYDTFGIDRVPVDIKNYTYNNEEDSKFLVHLSNRIAELIAKLNPMTDEIIKNNEEERFDYDLVYKAIKKYEDMVVSSYFLKNIINRMALNNKEVLSFYGETIRETLKKFDKLLNYKIAFAELKNQTINFVLNGIISFKQKINMDKKLNDIVNIMEYYSEQKLFIDDLKN